MHPRGLLRGMRVRLQRRRVPAMRRLVIVTYWFEERKRYRACVGNVGEDGILADTWYRVEGGKLAVA